jgi:hypothetical protein
MYQNPKKFEQRMMSVRGHPNVRRDQRRMNLRRRLLNKQL